MSLTACGPEANAGTGSNMRKTSWAIAYVLGMTVSWTAQAQQAPASDAGGAASEAVGPDQPSADSAAAPAPSAASPTGASVEQPAVGAPPVEQGAGPNDWQGDEQAAAATPVAVDASARTSESSAPADAPPWGQRFVPTAGLYGEVGLFLGVLFPSADHNFHYEFAEHQGLGSAAFDFGIRAAFLPIPYGGIELEGALMPTATDDDQGATIWSARVHGLLQAPVSRISPFLLVGGGRMGALSDPLENDADPLLHFGIGAKLGINDRVLARLDVRDNLTQKNGADEGSLTHHPEILLGLSYRLPPIAGEQSQTTPTDTDGDGFADGVDACPDQPGPAPRGCPILDADEDGFPDEVDECPDERGVEPHGCPPVDTDGDGFFDDSDECPNEPGIAPAGCPSADTDGDGITDADDRCRDQPETANGYEDDDGCPDELPQAVQEFTGAIQGIQFATGKATITADSHATLDRAVAVLNEYPKLRIEVAGHTDNVGERAVNLELSKQRALAVKTYLIEQGIDDARVETVGHGPDRPLMSNDTAEGRKQNRRIEFRLLP
jgi:outer membrane protein OmpA-like peptidoglycan-associated protein